MTTAKKSLPALRLIPSDPRLAVVKWRPAHGKDAELPDDEISVLVGWSEDQSVAMGFHCDGAWRGEESACRFKPQPDWWAHTPEVPPAPEAKR